jgi:uncharacterized lipoprotein YddW (UPF0748 family)
MTSLTITQPTVFKKTTAQSSDLPASAKASVRAGQTLEVHSAFRVGQHCWVKLSQPIAPVGNIGYFFLPHVEVTLEEIRSVWLTNTDSQILESRAQIEQGLQHLKAIGINTIYPVVWQRGFTLYPSPIAQAFIGSATVPDPKFATRDTLADVVEVAKTLQLRVIPWFEYGLATLPKSVLATQKFHCLTTDKTGNPIRTKRTDGKPDSFVWLNPCHPEVKQFFVDLIVDVVDRYNIDGIQLDDHFGFPVELGQDDFTNQCFKNENRINWFSQWFKSIDRTAWKTQKMTELLSNLVQRIKVNHPDCLISISPNPLAFSQTNYCVDWQHWIQQGLVDELVLQVYRDNLTSFVNEIEKPEITNSCQQIPVSIGVLAGLKQKSVSTDRLQQQLNEVRRRNFAGVSCFFYETLLHETLSPAPVPRDRSQLQRLFQP